MAAKESVMKEISCFYENSPRYIETAGVSDDAEIMTALNIFESNNQEYIRANMDLRVNVYRY